MTFKFFERLQQYLRLFAIMRQVPLFEFLKRARGSAKRRLRFLRANTRPYALALIWVALLDRLYGPESGNRFHWNSRLARNWSATEARLFSLFRAGQTEILRSFIEGALLSAPGAVTIMFLARSAMSRDIVAEYLRDADMMSKLVARAEKSSNFEAGLMAAAAFLLDAKDLEQLGTSLAGASLKQSANTAALIDSFATKPGAAPTVLAGTVAAAPSRKPSRHRLIIVNTLENPTRLSLLFAGAEKVSLFSPSNLYGRMELTAKTPLHARPKKLQIVHPRSRATRFSQAYHSLHDETRQIAEEIIAEIVDQADDYLVEAAPYLALGVADALFFKGLPVVGLRELIADPEIDQILIVGSDKIGNQFLQVFAGMEDLEHDPRLEFTSLALSERSRIQFTKTFAQAFSFAPLAGKTIAASVRPLRLALAGLRTQVALRNNRMALWTIPVEPKPEPRPRVLFVTSPDSAYNTASAAYADILIRRFNTLIGVVGKNAVAIFGSSPNLPVPRADRVQLLPTSPDLDMSLLVTSLRHVLEQVSNRHRKAGTFLVTAQVLQAESQNLAQNTLASGLCHWENLLHWFGQMQRANMKPDVLVVSPLRPFRVGMAAAAARRYGVPSLALEPHTINAEYCRYTRVMTDRYGTVSTYLASLAENGFSIPAERIDIIGSPRLLAKPSRSPDEARHDLETAGLATFLQGRKTLLFFSQPSKWPQISEVWRMILAAIAPHEDLQILLKVHPEEDGLRVSGYMAIAEEMGLSSRVQSVTASPPLLIEAADLVLACYSTTLVEAALAGRPVVSVVNEGKKYPMDQHKVVGAPQYQNLVDLSAALTQFLKDPSQSAASLVRFLEDNPQFVSGPEPHLCAAIDALVRTDTSDVLRPAEDLPPRLFIEGPYRVYDV